MKFYCNHCGMYMCGECDVKMHQGRRQHHIRSEAKMIPKREEEKDTRSFLLLNDQEDLMVSSND